MASGPPLQPGGFFFETVKTIRRVRICPESRPTLIKKPDPAEERDRNEIVKITAGFRESG
jgi:hypothetical protein